ncbi:hypothetical protein [Allopontixanthobacter sp.]|uniref:hypothetical protein n=1 Tax=Allopontixanthobacter sp. TaxID=2906452 RepID=UPI002AB811C6|nr:hypothetical protein [Allopontixanthobacter sp.]MDZ4307031.1 hypothetical protein [Allopontixanthobacter sp.]
MKRPKWPAWMLTQPALLHAVLPIVQRLAVKPSHVLLHLVQLLVVKPSHVLLQDAQRRSNSLASGNNCD